MEADRIKWNNRFASEDSFLGRQPSPFLAREIDAIKRLLSGRQALDIACGEGRNSVFLASHGFAVTGIDLAEAGLVKAADRAAAAGVTVTLLHEDLDNYRFSGRFDLIINFNFLQRRLIPEAMAVLAPGGLFLFDTLLAPALPPPGQTDFYLQPGELRRLFAPFAGEILCYEEPVAGEMPTARLMFRKEGGTVDG
ncbi:MAG: class I SAM-dependent methyltransferase [Geobacter sp.]|nr:class I SAM-dependent methyltransferase [Geobacter sp.]